MSVPARIGRYRVQRRLGSGAFASVWLAEDDVLESFVAIKVLADNWAHQLDIRARFTEEARILRRADSDRLVRVLDIGDLPDGRPYLVMTYADGGTVADRLAYGPLSVYAALRVAGEIARGVAVLHSAGVIHRDLKPSNILLTTRNGREHALVADLGLAKAVAQASGFTVAAGSPGYMAPEQAVAGGGLDLRADVYAIGAVAYSMLTGGPPTSPASLKAVAAAAATPVVPPSARRAGVPPFVDEVVLTALHADPDRRWPSAVALAEALADALVRVEAAIHGPTEAVHRPTGTPGGMPGPTTAPPRAAPTPAVGPHAAPALGPHAAPVPAARSHAAPTPAPRPPAPPLALPAPPREEPVSPRRRFRRRLAVAAAVVAGLLGLGGGALAAVRPWEPDWVRVADSTGTVSVEVPAAWAGQVQGAGWDPAVLRLPAGSAPGLAVAPDLTAWRDPAGRTAGVFVGASRAFTGRGAAPVVPDHEDCTPGTPRRYRDGPLRGDIHPWTRCAGTPVSFREIVLIDPEGDVGFYLQIKQAGGPDHTDRILASLRFSPR